MKQHDRREPDESQLAWFARTCLPGESEAAWFARMNMAPPEERRPPNGHDEEWLASVRPGGASNLRSGGQKKLGTGAMTPRHKKWLVIAVVVAVLWVVGKVALDARRSSPPPRDNVSVTSNKYYEYCVASGHRDSTELKDCEDTADLLGVDPNDRP